MAAKHEPRFVYSKNQGENFGTFVSDPNYLFKKSLLPLDKNEGRLQSNAFKRTSPFGEQFKQEVASII